MHNRDDFDGRIANSVDDSMVADQNFAKFRRASFLDQCAGRRESAESLHGLSDAIHSALSVDVGVSGDECVNGPQVSSRRVSPQEACHP